MRDFRTGRAAADNQDGARQQLLRVAIVSRVDLHDPARVRPVAGRDRRLLEGTSGENDVARLPGAAVGLQREAIAVFGFLAEGRRGDAQAYGSTDMNRVFLEKLHDMVAMRKAVRIVRPVGVTGQRQRPVRELERERIPSLASPPLGYAGSLDDHVFASEPAEGMTHRQAGLAATHDDRVDFVAHLSARRFIAGWLEINGGLP